MTWQTDDTDVVSQVLTTKLCSKTNLMSLFKELLFEVEVAESTSCLVASSREIVVILDTSELNSEEVLLCRSTTNHEADVVWRASSRSKALHLLNEERYKSTLILNSSLGHWVEIGLVGRATTLSYHDETVFSTLNSLDVDLCGEVTLRVNLVIHIQRSVL